MGRENLFSSPQNLSETRAQDSFEKPSSSLILVSTSQTKEDCLRLAFNGSGPKITTVNLEIQERDWEEVFLKTGLGQYNHFAVVPQTIAYTKAHAVVESNRQAKVIATDVVALTDDGKILGKPISLEEAMIMIASQGGRTVTQIAGTAYWDGQEWLFGQTKVLMKRCHNNDEEIERYIETHPSVVLRTAGGLPITDQKVLENFYENGKFPISSFCFNQRGGKSEVSFEEDTIGINNHPLLVQTVNGLSPNLLRAMKII